MASHDRLELPAFFLFLWTPYGTCALAVVLAVFGGVMLNGVKSVSAALSVISGGAAAALLSTPTGCLENPSVGTRHRTRPRPRPDGRCWTIVVTY